MTDAAANLNDVFETVGVQSVVWIDDVFDNGAPSSLIPSIVEALLVLHERKSKFEMETIFSLDPEDPFNEWRGTVEKACTDEPTLTLQVARKLSRLCGDEVQFEYFESELEELTKAMPVIKMGFEQWSQVKNSHLEGMCAGKLFLIDRQYKRSASEVENRGDEILSELVAVLPEGAFAVILTHSVSHANVAQLRKDIAETRKIPESAFSVVSKQRELGDAASKLVQRPASTFLPETL